MQFLSLASAWFAIALAAIAAMYILKRTYQDQEISSHLLWRRVLQEQEANRPWQRLRSRLLLLLQLLAALLVVFALMEPVLMNKAKPTGHAVLLIDRSASMTAVGLAKGDPSLQTDAHTRLEQAILQAERWLDEQSKSRPVSLVMTGAQPEVLASRVSDKDKVKQLLQDIVPHYGHSDNTAALSLADSLLQGDTSGQIYLFTDEQWADKKDAEQLQLHTPVHIYTVDTVGEQNNLAIIYFGIKADPNDEDMHSGVVTVRNDSSTEQSVKLEVLAVQADHSQQMAAEPVLTVKPGEWESVQVSALPKAAYYKAKLSRSTDAVLADNIAYQFPSVTSERQILLITKGNVFLEKALLLAGIQAVKISPDSKAPEGDQVDQADWVILDGMDERLLADESWTKLLASKPLWMIDHPESLASGTAVPASNRVVTKEHPVTSYITFSDTHIGRFATPESKEVAWGEAILSYGGVPAIYAGNWEGMPRLRFTFHLQDTDLPLRPEFPVLIVQSAEWMSGGLQLELGTAAAEQSLELSLHSETKDAIWQAVELSAAGLPSEQSMLSQPNKLVSGAAGTYVAPSIPGLYRLVETNGRGTIVSDRLLAVTADLNELMSSAEAEDRSLKLSYIGSNMDETDHADKNAGKSDREQLYSLQMWIAMLLLLLMAAEWEVYRRGHSG